MGCLEHGITISNISPRSDPKTSDLCRKSIAQIIAIQIRRRDDTVFVRPQQSLLKHIVGDAVLDHNSSRWDLATRFFKDLAFGNCLIAELCSCDVISPIFES